MDDGAFKIITSTEDKAWGVQCSESSKFQSYARGLALPRDVNGLRSIKFYGQGLGALIDTIFRRPLLVPVVPGPENSLDMDTLQPWPLKC